MARSSRSTSGVELPAPLTRVHRASARSRAPSVPVFFVVFDVLALGRRLRKLPWESRRKVLAMLVRGNGIVRPLDYLEGHGRELLEFCRAPPQHRRGGTSSIYREGPAHKRLAQIRPSATSFVVVGFTKGKGARASARSTWPTTASTLVARGKVGSGLDEAMVDLLLEKLKPLITAEKPCTGDPGDAPLGRTFVRPEIVVTVRFLGWSDGGSLLPRVPRDHRPRPTRLQISPHGKEPEPDADAPPTARALPRSVYPHESGQVFWPTREHHQRRPLPLPRASADDAPLL